MKAVFADVYKGRKVLITGHTGFKGSWLSLWLSELGAVVAGYSDSIYPDPSNFEVLCLKSKLIHFEGDIRNFADLKQVFDEFKPEIVFHLAAQAITRLSYAMPQETFFTNVGGTVNVLECIRLSNTVKTALIITSDKCYQNLEWVWGYRENDKLGGDDPYSASKACAEIVCSSYVKSYFRQENSANISTARAGNVIGGGDWAVDRIVPDYMRALYDGGKPLQLRNPNATRPWQHVLEPLSGYLWLGVRLWENDGNVVGESFNFGPSESTVKTVEELVKEIGHVWNDNRWIVSQEKEKKESTLLKLDCSKAAHLLDWRAILSFEKMARMTALWYKTFYDGQKDMYNLACEQINDYVSQAEEFDIKWAKTK